MKEERFAIAYAIPLFPSGREVMAIKSRYPTRELLEREFQRELNWYNRNRDEGDLPPRKVEILNERQCKILD